MDFPFIKLTCFPENNKINKKRKYMQNILRKKNGKKNEKKKW